MKQNVVVVLLAVVALVLAIASMGMMVSMKNGVIDTETKITDLEDRISQVSTDQASSMNNLIVGIKQEFDKVNSEVSALNMQITELSSKGVKKQVEAAPAGGAATAQDVVADKPAKPAKPADGVHIVEKGESIKAICKMYNVSENAIAVKNPTLEIYNLKAGQKIKIP